MQEYTNHSNEDSELRKEVVKILKDFGQTGNAMGIDLCFVAARMFMNGEVNTPRAETIRKAMKLETF